MNDFKSYSNAKNSGNLDGSAGKSGDGEIKKTAAGSPRSEQQLNNTVEMAKIITKAMNGKSTAQIMQTIIAEAERGKREGTLTNADLDNFYNTLSPILDGAKKRKLKQVIASLKEI